MCRLFGYIARRPVNPSFAFFSGEANLYTLSQIHNDGWGVAWTSSAGWELYKEGVALYKSENARKVLQQVNSMLAIAHIRKASPEFGEVNYENTHPFVADGWAFAHNGTVRSYSELRRLLGDRASRLQGKTDSEAFFHLILKFVEEARDPVEGVALAVSEVDRLEYTSINSVFSDGSRLYALNKFRSTNTEYYTMYIGRFMIEGVELVAVASQPLGGLEGWERVGNGKLVVVDRTLTPTVYHLG
ncbi:class II glutamine amidotransferase [Infirmifilum lucidum]|uniref:Class II glutamine amidotransferase n=1 Tax=Infirmifilum lucidum TaxID=2776706 RepID=A0A7L9FIL5_9CREN|nr:class II glutamine amidotransferase [Infirmifilum lucidum]QOJ78764.1 class II glutamine amidotransferase [Infirmifilum lucidum]